MLVLDLSLPLLVRRNRIPVPKNLKVYLRLQVLPKISLLLIILDLDLSSGSLVQQNQFQLFLQKRLLSLDLLDLLLRRIRNLIKVLDHSLPLLVKLSLRVLQNHQKVYLNSLDLLLNLSLQHLMLDLEKYLRLEVLQKQELFQKKYPEHSHLLDLFNKEKQNHIMVLVHCLDFPVPQNPLRLLFHHSYHCSNSVELLQNPLYLHHILDLVLYMHSPVQPKPEQYLQNLQYSLSLLEILLRHLQNLNLDLDLSLQSQDPMKQLKLYLRLLGLSLLYSDSLERVIPQLQKLELV